MDTEQRIQSLREDWWKANPRQRIIIEAHVKDIKKRKIIHKCSAGIRSYREGMMFVFICACGEELGRDYLQTKHT